MIALPHLIFLTILYLAGLTAWLVRWDRLPEDAQIASTVVAGLAAGIFLGAWV